MTLKDIIDTCNNTTIIDGIKRSVKYPENYDVVSQNNNIDGWMIYDICGNKSKSNAQIRISM